MLLQKTTLIECPASMSAFRRLHRRWVLGALVVLGNGFEPEAVGEFLYLNARIPVDAEPSLTAHAALVAVRDALELLRGLRSTLDYDPAD